MIFFMLFPYGSWFQMDTEKEMMEYFGQNQLGMYLVSRQIDITRLPAYGEHLTIKVWIYNCEKTWGHRNTILYDENGKVCMASTSMGSFINLKTGRPIRIPPEIINVITIEPPFNMDVLPRKIAVPDGIIIEKEPITVQNYHLDSYRHMNNSRYVDIATSCLPDDFQVHRVRIEYKKPAIQGDVLTPKIIQLDNKVWVYLKRIDDICALIEFS